MLESNGVIEFAGDNIEVGMEVGIEVGAGPEKSNVQKDCVPLLFVTSETAPWVKLLFIILVT